MALGLAAAVLSTPPALAAEKQKKTSGGLSYTLLPTLTAPMLAGGRRGVITVESGIDTPDPALKAKVDLLEPRLRDAYTGVMARFAASLAPGAPPDVETLVLQLQQATDRVVGRPGCRFLIGTVIVE